MSHDEYQSIQFNKSLVIGLHSKLCYASPYELNNFVFKQQHKLGQNFVCAGSVFGPCFVIQY